MLDIRLLRFLTIAECGSFTRAEAVLNISKQALSKHVKSLEEELGFPLFFRRHNGISLTPGGQMLFQNARQIKSNLQEALRHSREVAGAQRCIRMGRIKHHMILEEVNRRFELQYPDVKVKMILSSSDRIIEQVSEGIHDVAETPFSQELGDSGLQYVRLLTIPFQCLMAKEHPLASHQKITGEDLASVTVTVYRMQWSDEQLSWLRSVAPNIRIQKKMLRQIEDVYVVCEQGGLFITPEYYAWFMDPLARIPLAHHFTREYGICFRRDPPEELQQYVRLAQEIYVKRQS